MEEVVALLKDIKELLNNQQTLQVYTVADVAEILHRNANDVGDIFKKKDFPRLDAEVGGQMKVIASKFEEWLEKHSLGD